MTSNVKIAAHCASNKEVIVHVGTSPSDIAVLVLQDGETREMVFYDDIAISLREQLKGTAETTPPPQPGLSLGQRVRLSLSGEGGVVIGKSVYNYLPDQYQVRYLAADGRQVEGWFTLDALVTAPEAEVRLC